ncbi:hypothetical protein [Candidiatus Paracoxiella cheracis]|uniref:hypothetical protein n=1 Tax=Candidiatus Paracoxiella cheracis TaxID=3405120 RepID=UPI003BF5EA45
MKTSIITALCLGVGLSFTTAASFAGQCPSNLHQDSEGYWTSNDTPGWKSVKPTDTKVTVESKNFGGAIYSPTQKRIACVYKGSDGQWVALISNVDHPFNEDNLNLKVWTFVNKHNIYICGTPKYKLDECTFVISTESH